jgi:hypothetical protein
VTAEVTQVAQVAQPDVAIGLAQMHRELTQLSATVAPVIFADSIPNFGHGGGVINISLSAGRPAAGGYVQVPVAHLRLTQAAARLLVESLQKAMAMMEKPPGPAN